MMVEQRRKMLTAQERCSKGWSPDIGGAMNVLKAQAEMDGQDVPFDEKFTIVSQTFVQPKYG